MPVRVTRRGALLVAAATLSACGSEDPPPASGPGPGSGVGVLNSVLALEHASLAAYAAAETLLRAPGRARLAVVAEQERDHVRRLSGLISDLGGRPVRGRPAGEYERSFPRLRDASDALLLAEDIEERQVRAHLDALSTLPGAELRRAAAGLATSEGEHLAVVRRLRGVAPAPQPFVTGTS